MTLLTEIIDAASGDRVPARTLLCKLKVVAARTQTGKLAEWVAYELDGYPDGSTLPSYRGPFEAPVMAHFMGPFNSQIRNIAIPPSTFPEDLRDGPLFQLHLYHSIAEVEHMASEGTTQIVWPQDAVRYYNIGVASGRIQPTVNADMSLVQAIRPYARQVFVGVVDAVRTRTLDLALELERVAPQAGEPGAPSDSRDQAQQVVSTYNFYGSTSNVAIGSSHVTQTVELPGVGDEAALLRYLAAAGTAPSDLVHLQAALAEDRAEAGGSHPAQPGSRVRKWMTQVGTSITTGAVSGFVVDAALKAFFHG